MSPRNLLRIMAVGTVSTLTATALATLPASAADGDFVMGGSAAGTAVTALDGTVVSGPTAAAGVSTKQTGVTNTNSTAEVDLGKLLKAKATDTKVSTAAITGGKQVTSVAKLAGLSVLNGLVRLNAVTTTSTVTVKDGLATYDGGTELLGLIVNNRKIPINVAKNTAITIPGVAKITLNKVQGRNSSDIGASVDSAGIEVTLLKASAGFSSGTTVLVTPTRAAIAPDVKTEGPTIGGAAYALKASLIVDGKYKVIAGPIATQNAEPGGTGNRVVQQSTARVNLPILGATALSTSVKGSRTVTHSEVTVKAHAATVNLLGGAITADVINASVSAARDAGAAQPTVSGTTEIVNLKIFGSPIKIDPSPNTVIDVAGLGKVVLNQQYRTANGLIVRAIDVVLSTKRVGIPAGAEVEFSAVLGAISK